VGDDADLGVASPGSADAVDERRAPRGGRALERTTLGCCVRDNLEVRSLGVGERQRFAGSPCAL
jgi:hypothetical protein